MVQKSINTNDKKQAAIDFLEGIRVGEGGEHLWLEYKDKMESITAYDLCSVLYWLLNRKVPGDELKSAFLKLINILKKKQSVDIEFQHGPLLIEELKKQNQVYKDRISDVEQYIVKINDAEISYPDLMKLRNVLLGLVEDLSSLEQHYEILVNSLLSQLEVKDEVFMCNTIFSRIFNDVVSSREQLFHNLESKELNIDNTDKKWDEFVYLANSAFFLEEYMLYPLAQDFIHKASWDHLYEEVIRKGFPFIKKI